MALELEEAISQALAKAHQTSSLVRIVLSGRRRNMNPSYVRIDIRPIDIKGSILLNIMSNDGVQTTTRNESPESAKLDELFQAGYANILVESTDSSMALRITKKGQAQVHFENQSREQNLNHDRVKSRLLSPSDPFLKEIGISDSQGKVKPTKSDKFLQVEEFLRILAPTVKNAISAGQLIDPTSEQPLEIVDLGCGHAYLTFAAHQYLQGESLPVHLLGVDIRESSRERNSEIAHKLGIEHSIEFQAAEISQLSTQRVDVAIALHACDTATDDALAWAVRSDAKIILSAPCCHHELQTQMRSVPEPWGLVTRNGLLKERLGDILTDALRVQILRLLGYRVETIEFIGGEHTPRNLMIRAVKTGAKVDSEEIKRYFDLIEQWQVQPALAMRLAEFMPNPV